MSKDIGFCSITEGICRKEGECKTCSLQHIYTNIEHYAKLHEQGRLIELPCALYDVVWSIQPLAYKYKAVRSDSIGSFSYSEEGLEMWDWNGVRIGVFGKTAFLTEEEAEAKLAELKGE